MHNFDHIVTFANDFHGTIARVKAQPFDCLSRDQIFRLSKRLCPNRLKRIKCECGGLISAIDINNKLKLVPHVAPREHRKTFLIMPVRESDMGDSLVEKIELKKGAEKYYTANV